MPFKMEPVPVIDARFRERIRRRKLNFLNKQSASIKKYVMPLLTSNPKEIRTDNYWRILKTLNQNFNSLSDVETFKLEEVLLYYVKAYPHWNELPVISKNLNKREKERNVDRWFTEFIIYLMLKMEDAWKIWKSLKDDKNCRLVQQQIQTDANTKSSYSIELEGPSNLNYSILFNISNGNVVAKQCFKTTFSLEKYKSMCRFINLPYVSVRGEFADISFERKNVHEIKRFITMTPVNLKKNYSKRVKVERINVDQEVSVYTFHFYTMYFRQFMLILHNELCISDTRKLEFQLVIDEILKDMEEAFVSSTVPTNARVTFTIGDNIYFRNKQTTTRDINYYEIINPEVALSIHHFEAKQDLSDKCRVTFKSLNLLEDREHFIEHMNNSRLVFECMLCSQCFLSLFTIQFHFKQEHMEEHAVICGSCRKEIEFASLVGNRWRHRCKGSQEL